MSYKGTVKPTLQLPSSYHALDYEQIHVSHVPASSSEPTPIILVTLYRPKNYNAFTDKMGEELEHIFTLLDVDDRVKAVVVTGDGKMFCAGSDLSVGFGGGMGDSREHRDMGGRVVLAMHRCRKPIIGAINGSAVGIGITMTLPMSIRVVYEKAKIGFVFARRGIIMEACSSFFLPRLIGTSKAMHLVTTGATYPANHKLLDTLFSETLSTPEAVLPRAIELANEIVNNTSAVSTFLMRDMMYRDTGSAEGQHMLDSKIIYELFSSRDHLEGVKAFMEKRPVHFQGTMQNDAPRTWPWYDAPQTGYRPVPEGFAAKRQSKI